MKVISQIAVRYAETDQMGVVYYANYLVWFEVGRSELLKACGLSYSEMEKMGVFLPVKEAYVKYIKSARYEDKLDVTAEMGEVSRSMVKISCEIKRGNELLTTGFTVHVFVNDRGQAIRAPKELVELLEGLKL